MPKDTHANVQFSGRVIEVDYEHSTVMIRHEGLPPEVGAEVSLYRHIGECTTDASARDVCEGIYEDRVKDNLALCEALRAVYALVGESKEVAKIVHDAIRQHGIDDA